LKVLEIKTKDLENNIVKLQKRAGDRKIIAVVINWIITKGDVF